MAVPYFYGSSPFLGDGADNSSVCNSTSFSLPDSVGFITASVSVVFFGSNFVPVKKFDTGDGMFFQWVLCVAIWITGLVFTAIRNFPKFYPLAMFGGALWATGNIMVVPIIKTMGLGLGMLIWGSFNLLSGWATDRFGLFGTVAADITGIHSTLNYIGVALAATSSVIFILVKPEVGDTATQGTVYEREPLIPPLQDDYGSGAVNDFGPEKMNKESFLDRMTPTQKRIAGIVMSLISGVCYGMSFTPVIYVKENYTRGPVSDGSGGYVCEPSPYDFDFVFAHFTGILATSTFYFVIYCVVMKNKPKLYKTAILPAFISGVMWAIADIAWFFSNDILSEAVSFPIITTGPGVIAALWGVIVFKEVKGFRNYVILIVAACVALSGAIVSGFSKQ